MKAIVTRYNIINNLETLGEDFIYLHVYFRTETHFEALMPVMFPLDELFDFVLTQNNPAGKYLKLIRKNIPGYGPKHSKVMEIIEEEAFDLEPYIFSFVESKNEEFVTDHMEWCDRLSSQKNRKAVKDSADKLSQFIDSDFINHQINITNFQDEVDKTLHELTLKYFPSLFDMEKKNIEAYKDILVRTTMSFTRDIDRTLHNKFKLHFEEKYNKRNNIE